MTEVSSITLILQPEQVGVMPAWLGRATQAHFLHRLQTLHPDVSRLLHDHSGAKPFTSSTLIGAQRKNGKTHLTPESTLRLRYTTIHPALTQIFQQGMLPIWEKQSIELQKQRLNVMAVQTDNTDNDWAGTANYVDLVDNASTMRHLVTLSFVAPTAFKRTAGYYAPLPQPELVFSSLLDRWNTFAPFRLPDWLYDTIHRDIVVDRAKIQTEKIEFAGGKRGTIPGFIGKVTYRFLCREEGRRYLNALTQFAMYSGVGVKTTVGMGQVRAA